MTPESFAFLNVDQIKTFILILVRNLAFVTVMPFLGASSLPGTVKVGLAFFLSCFVAPLVPVLKIEDSLWAYLFYVAGESLIGLMIGFATIMFFSIGQTAGYIIGIEIGFSMASLIDPFTDESVSIIGQLFFFVMTLVMFATNTHLLLIKGLADSFSFIPLTGLQLSGDLIKKIVDIFIYVFTAGVQMASPLLFITLIVYLGKALIARTAPEVNILMLGFPILILIGFVGLNATMPLTVMMMRNYLNRMIADMYIMLRLM